MELSKEELKSFYFVGKTIFENCKFEGTDCLKCPYWALCGLAIFNPKIEKMEINFDREGFLELDYESLSRELRE